MLNEAVLSTNRRLLFNSHWNALLKELQAARVPLESVDPQIKKIKSEIEELLHWLDKQQNHGTIASDTPTPWKNQTPLPKGFNRHIDRRQMVSYLEWLLSNGIDIKDLKSLHLPPDAIDVIAKYFPEIKNGEIPEELAKAIEIAIQ